jgi:hypothetical protein
LGWRKAWPDGTKAGAFIAYFGERVVGGRAGRSPRGGGRSAVEGETTLAPDWLRAARMPSETGPEQRLCAQVSRVGTEGKTCSEVLVGVRGRGRGRWTACVAYGWRSGGRRGRDVIDVESVAKDVAVLGGLYQVRSIGWEGQRSVEMARDRRPMRR